MSDIDIEAFRVRLLERREQLLFDHGSTMEQVGRSADHATPDAVDMAAESSEFDVAVSAANIEGQELESIDHALERLERGEFGQCEECNDPINRKRLEALPFARFCIECQRAFEENRQVVHDDF